MMHVRNVGKKVVTFYNKKNFPQHGDNQTKITRKPEMGV
jgi:hypothetical protein